MIRFKTSGWIVVLTIYISGCESPQIPSSNPTEQQADTLTVIASRLWSSNTYQTYLEPIAKSEGCAIRWINASAVNAIELASILPEADGVLLTGGADIHPERYQQAEDTIVCGVIEPERDQLESLLLQWVDKMKTPCLGICRGMQFMNVHNGGTLHPHLPAVLGNDLHRAGDEASHRDTLHTVVATKSLFGVFAGDTSFVVSHHHQGVNQLATPLEAWAISPDGLVEGIRRSDTINYPCYLGVQWHPERSTASQPMVESMGLTFITSMAADLR